MQEVSFLFNFGPGISRLAPVSYDLGVLASDCFFMIPHPNVDILAFTCNHKPPVYIGCFASELEQVDLILCFPPV